jgi:hypothetical protein
MIIRRKFSGTRRRNTRFPGVGLPALLAAALLCSGCAAAAVGAAAGAGVYTWLEGDLVRVYQTEYVSTLEAANGALQSLEISVVEIRRSSLSATIKGEVYNGKPVSVVIRRSAPNQTEVAVRSGWIGYLDREQAELVHAAIAERLDE